MHICRFQILHLTATEATRAAVRDFVNPKQALCVYASQVYSPRCASKMQMGMAVRCCSSRRPNCTGSVSVGSQWVQGCLASHCWEPWWLEKCVCAGESPGPPSSAVCFQQFAESFSSLQHGQETQLGSCIRATTLSSYALLVGVSGCWLGCFKWHKLGIGGECGCPQMEGQ